MRLWLWLCTSLLPCSHGKTLFDHVTSQCFFSRKILTASTYLVTYLGFGRGSINTSPPVTSPSTCLPFFLLSVSVSSIFLFFFFASTVSQVLFLLLLLRVSGNLTFFGCPTSFLLLFLPHYTLITLILPHIFLYAHTSSPT